MNINWTEEIEVYTIFFLLKLLKNIYLFISQSSLFKIALYILPPQYYSAFIKSL